MPEKALLGLLPEQIARRGLERVVSGAIFQQAYTANKSINATVEANDGLAGAVITVLGAGVAST